MSAFSSTRVARNALFLVLLASVSACAGTREPTYPVPDEPGIYAFTTKDNLRRLDGDRDWEVETWPERSNMPSNVHFVINEPALAGRSAGNAVELWRVAWVRSEIDPQGQAMPVQGSQWAVAPLEPFSIPFRYESPAGQTEIVHIVPTVPLEPGLYTLRIASPGARQARVGVTWNGTDQRQYSAMNCVDRYDGSTYRPCNAAVGAAPAPAGDPHAAGLTADASNGGLASLSPPQPAPPGASRGAASARAAGGRRYQRAGPADRPGGSGAPQRRPADPGHRHQHQQPGARDPDHAGQPGELRRPGDAALDLPAAGADPAAGRARELQHRSAPDPDRRGARERRLHRRVAVRCRE